MQVFGGSKSVAAGSGPYAVGLGIFDGVHRGHRSLLGKVLELAQRDGLKALAYTFHPHPAHLLAPKHAPQLIEPIETRVERLGGMGFHGVLVEPFTRELADMPAETFVLHVLLAKLQAKHVVVGSDFAFGKDRGGNVAFLEGMGARLGFEVHPVPLLQHAGTPVSSTRIRKLVAAGEVRSANDLLGRPFALSGVVLRGHQRATGLGFPTANLEPHNELMPLPGVYAARVNGPVSNAPAVVNVGYSPTFNVGRLRVEVHLLDFPPRPLYGLSLDVDFIDRLRDEQRFSGVEALVDQVKLDIAAARRIFGLSQAP